MFYFIIILLLLIFFFRFGTRIKKLFQLYRNYKSLIDPENKISHIQIIRNGFKLLMSVIYSTYQIYHMDTNNLYNVTNTNNITKKNINDKEKFNKKYVKISYKYKDKSFYYLLKIPKGVIPLKSITDDCGNDIYDIIEPYLGPNLDCHGSAIYPKDFGYNQIKITTVFDKVITFDEDQKIDLVV
jgi:hypothetical protein